MFKLCVHTQYACSIFIVVLSGHQCEKNGCGSVLVVDGNMKNARTVCSVKNVGQLIFEGIGNVTVGK